MNLHLLLQKSKLVKLYREAICIAFFLCTFTVLYAQQSPQTIDIPWSQVTVHKYPITHTRTISLLAPDPNAVYSDITNFTGYGVSSGVAQNVGGTRMTALAADRLVFAGTAPYPITALSFSAGNSSTTTDINVSVKIRFYQDKAGPLPGTYIGGYNFTATTLQFGYVYTFTFNPPSLTIPASTIWAGVEFDNTGSSPNPTIANMKLLSVGLYDPPDVGSSDDAMFWTTNGGDFAGNNPAGTYYTSPFGGAPVCNAGWEFVIAAPVPIGIEYLHGLKAGSNHNLSWKIDDVINPINMSLERSPDNRAFTSIYTTSGNASTCQYPFNYTDSRPLAGLNFYRVKVTGADGKVNYSSIVPLLNKLSGFEMVNIQPNPVVPSTATMNVTSAQKDQLQIVIFDMTGKKVGSQTVQLIAGNNQVILNVSKFAKGAYQVKGVNSAGDSQTIQLLKD